MNYSPYFWGAALVTLVMVFIMLWQAYKLMRTTAEIEKKLVMEDRRLFARLLDLTQKLDVKANITVSGNQQLIDGASVVAADLQEAHLRADQVDHGSPVGMAADAAARGNSAPLIKSTRWWRR